MLPTVAGPGLSIYGESTVIDPTSFQYTGPGGVPDLSEKWDAPGTPGLEPGTAWLADASSKARVLHASLRDDVVHTVDLIASKTVNARLVVAAYDAQTLAPVTSIEEGPIRILVAAKLGATRLIDNIGV